MTKLSPDGQSIIFSAYLGGSNTDDGWSITIDANDNVIFTGATSSSNFPTVNAYQETKGAGSDTFVAKFSEDGQSLIFATYLGDNVDTSSTQTATGTNSTENTVPPSGFELFIVLFGLTVVVTLAARRKRQRISH